MSKLKGQNKTIAVSPRIHQMLVKIARKDQTFDNVLEELLQGRTFPKMVTFIPKT